jgi:peroxiredoxin
MLANSAARRILFSLVFVISLVWTIATRPGPASILSANAPPNPHENFSAPDFTLETMDGEQIGLSDQRGEVVLVNFWASWCLPCKAEMPAMEEIYRAYEPLGFVVLAVNTTDQDSLEKAAAFVSENGLTFPVLLDRDGSFSRLYAIRGLPTSFFIDRDGIIREVVVGGPMSAALIQSRIEDLLGEER